MVIICRSSYFVILFVVAAVWQSECWHCYSFIAGVILNNLIGNGFKYQDFTKEQPFLKVWAEAKHGRCLIQITDNGIGIRKEHHSRIFEMFYLANDSMAGSGLGLYIAREAADKLQSTITFESEYGKGSVFTLSMPFD